MSPIPSPPSSSRSRLEHLCAGLLAYYLTSLTPLLGVVLGHDQLRPPPGRGTTSGDVLAAFANADGRWYAQILKDGYAYDPQHNSNVAFFPAFPLLGRLMATLTGLAPEPALLLVAHVCLASAFVVFAAYAQRRSVNFQSAVGAYALVALGLLPTGFFFRMAYSESLFLLATLLALYSMEREWPLPLIAAVIGFATATRPVGVALLPPLLLHLWGRAPTRAGALWRAALLLPLACWGLLAFMAYQYAAFGDPLAFARTQQHWRVRPAVPLPERLLELLRLEPVWSVFDPSSPCYWRRHEPQGNPLFSLHLANPIYFVLTVGLIVLGACKRWLNRVEVTLAAGLLLIPYATRSHEMCMGAMGRFAAVVVPAYLVLGQLLARLPPMVVALLAALSGFFLGAYAALFAAGYRFF